MKKLIRTIHPETRIVDAKKGIVDYVASDESLDSYREVIRASGWRFTNFQRNAPFVDSHDYGSIDKLLGKVIDFEVKKNQLIERVQWAIDVPDAKLAQLGWKLTEAGYLKAVSVGFWPTHMITKWDADRRAEWLSQLGELGFTEDNAPRTIYTEQEQIELSACIIGANPNALAKAYKAGTIGDPELELISQEYTKRQTVPEATDAADASRTRQRQREEFLERLERTIKAF